MPIRIVAIDIDGTLLDSSWQLPDRNRDAVAAAARAGVEITIVTGRRHDFARPILARRMGSAPGIPARRGDGAR